MDNLMLSLRRFYLTASLPPVAFLALFYFSADEPLVDARMSYMLCFIVYLLAFVSVLGTHVYMSRTEKKIVGKEDVEQVRIFSQAYKLRIVLLNVVSFLSSLFYFVTVVESCYYMTLIITLLVILSYPSKQYIMRDKE